MPPEMESEVWEEYKRLNEWSVGERFEPLTEKWYVSPAIYAPWLALHLNQEQSHGQNEVCKGFFKFICIFSVGSMVLVA